MKAWITTLVLLASFWGAPAMGAQTLLDTDSFSGSNGDDLVTYNSNWPTTTGGAALNPAKIAGTPGVGGIGSSYRTGQTWTNDHWAELVVDGTNLPDIGFGRWWIILREQGAATFSGYVCGTWMSFYGNHIYHIGRFDAGTYTDLVAEPGSSVMQNSDTVNCQISGTVITLTVTRSGGGSAFTPLTYDTVGDGTTYSTGNPGLFMGRNPTSDRLAGSWRAGSVTGGGAAAIGQYRRRH